MSRLFIVRHGNTFKDGDPPRRIGSRTDLPLTAAGQRQAEALGRHFAESSIVFTRALTSPLRRTRDTAVAILARQPQPAPPLDHSDLLTEIDHGPDENQPEDVVAARVGRPALDAWDQQGLPPAGWQVEPERRVDGWQELLQQAAETVGDTLVVTSNGAARFVLLAVPPEVRPARLRLRTGHYGLITCRPGAAPHIEAWDIAPNVTSHPVELSA